MSLDNGLTVIEELQDLVTNIKSMVFDLDQKSGYPSNTMAANVSKDTTHREIIDIEGIARDIFKIQNMNLAYGITNSIEYSMVMFNLPSLFSLVHNIERT